MRSLVLILQSEPRKLFAQKIPHFFTFVSSISLASRLMVGPRTPLFSHGDKVEVRSDAEGFRGAWFEATITRTMLQTRRHSVIYDSLLSDDMTPLKEVIKWKDIRPRPPKMDSHLVVGQKVEAYHNDGWWNGVVSKIVSEGKWSVRFPVSREVLEFGRAEIRPRLEWKGRRWIKSRSWPSLTVRGKRKDNYVEGEGVKGCNIEKHVPQQASEVIKQVPERGLTEGHVKTHSPMEVTFNKELLHQPCRNNKRTKHLNGCTAESVDKVTVVEHEDGVQMNCVPIQVRSELSNATSEQGHELQNLAISVGQDIACQNKGIEWRQLEALLNAAEQMYRAEAKTSTEDTSSHDSREPQPPVFFLNDQNMPPESNHQDIRVAFDAQSYCSQPIEEHNGTLDQDICFTYDVPSKCLQSVAKRKDDDDQYICLATDVEPECSPSVTEDRDMPLGEGDQDSCLTHKNPERHNPEGLRKFDPQLNKGTVETPNIASQKLFCFEVKFPFIMTSLIWKSIESMELYTVLPQRPHFSPLEHYHEDFREGMAIGLMVNFEKLVSSINKQTICDPLATFEQKQKDLLYFESHGFDVSHAKACLERLLQIRHEHFQRIEELHGKISDQERKITELKKKKEDVDKSLEGLNKIVTMLHESRASIILQLEKSVTEIAKLQEQVLTLKQASSAAELDVSCTRHLDLQYT